MIFQQTTTSLLATAWIAGITTLSSRADSLGNLSYSDNGTSITITDCADDTTGAMIVPSLIDGKPVTAIGDAAFVNCTKITSVTLPASVTSLGESAFMLCYSLASINLPEGVTSLGYNCFYDCGKLKSIDIPSTVTSTGGPFHNSGVERATIANGTVTVAGSLFWSCSNLVEVTLPASVKTIGKEAFAGCNALRDFSNFKSVTTIGDSAFAGCGFRSISLSDRVTALGENAFIGNTTLEEIRLPANLKTIPKRLLQSSYSLKSIRIPDSVVSIGNEAFRGSGLVTVSIPSKVKTIGNGAFNRCGDLNSAKFSGKAPTLGTGVFRDTARDFTIFLEDGSKGFTLPKWHGYRTSLPRPEILVQSSTKTFDFLTGDTESFKGALPGSAGTFRTFTITNTGIRPLTNFNAIIKAPSQFSVKKPKISSLAPGKSIVLKVWFKPQVAGNHKAQVRILSNDSNENPFIINLKGVGLTKN